MFRVYSIGREKP